MPGVSRGFHYWQWRTAFNLRHALLNTEQYLCTVQYCFLFRFVCMLVSLVWFLQIWLRYSKNDQLVQSNIKKLMQTYIVIVSGSIHLNGIWLLIWHYLSRPVLGGHPVLSGRYSIPRGFPLNTDFTVITFSFSDFMSRINHLKIANEIPPHFVQEIKTKGYDLIGVNVFLRKLMRSFSKKAKQVPTSLFLVFTFS